MTYHNDDNDDIDAARGRHHNRARSRSPHRREDRRQRHEGSGRLRRGEELSERQDFRWGKETDGGNEDAEPEKEPEPDFGLSGALAAEANTEK